MINLDEFGFRRAQTFAFEHAIVVHGISADLRWALAALVIRSFAAMWIIGRARFLAMARKGAHRRAKEPFPDQYCRC